jgi:hypothetical protein
MGYKCQVKDEKAGANDYRIMEVVLVKKGSSTAKIPETRVVAVDNQWETLHYVQDHMDDFIRNILRIKKIEEQDQRIAAESEQLFERNLEPLFSIVTKSASENVMEKLSLAMRKALLLMAMDKFNCNKDNICEALGLSQDKLEGELRDCGLVSYPVKGV